jgi:hypothetical protein
VFTIHATVDTIPMLVDGQTLYGHVDVGSMKYFQISLIPGYHLLTLSVSDFYGHSGLMVLNSEVEPKHDEYNTFQYNVPWWSTTKTLSINEHDSTACTMSTHSNGHSSCVYTIGIWGHQNSSFSITARIASSITPLLNGVAIQDHLETGHWTYYSVRVITKMDLTVMLTTLSG